MKLVASKASRIILLLIALLAFLAVVLLWFTDQVQTGQLDYQVDPPIHIPQLETPWLYLLLMAFSFFPVFFLSFDKQVRYSSQWKYLFPAILMAATPFIIWDAWFTRQEVWGFNESYLVGLRVFGLPLEECLFFLVIPFACGFIYENVRVKVRRTWCVQIEPMISLGLLLFLIVGGVRSWGMIYSFSSYSLMAAFLSIHLVFGDQLIRAQFFLSFAWSLIPFLLVDGVLTGIATKAPVVVYNPAEFLGWRIWTIPVDDAIYGMLLLFGTIQLMEKFRAVGK